MKIRVMGTTDECDQFAQALQAVPGLVLEVSGPYPNRGNSLLCRTYIEAAWPPAGGVPTVIAAAAQIEGAHAGGQGE